MLLLIHWRLIKWLLVKYVAEKGISPVKIVMVLGRKITLNVIIAKELES